MYLSESINSSNPINKKPRNQIIKMNNNKKSSPVKESSLQSLRSEIDFIDQQLIQLFDKRASLVFEVGEWKKNNLIDVYDPQREQQIIEKTIKTKRLFLNDSEIQSLFIKMIDFFRNIEKARSLISETSPNSLLKKRGSFGFFGFGLIGASIALALKESFPEWNFLVHDPHLDKIEFEKWNENKTQSKFQLVSIDNLTNKLSEELAVVFLAAPIDKNAEFGKAITKRNSLILNLGSVQEPIDNVIGFHPLAGKEISGYQAAQGDLFYGKTICLSPPKNIDKLALEASEVLAKKLGAEVVITPWEVHNERLAYSSHLTQLLSMVYGITLDKNYNDDLYSLIPSSARDFLRLSGSDYKMWEPIIRKNNQFIKAAMIQFEKNFQHVRKLIEESSSQQSLLKDLFIKAQFIYEKIYKKRKQP